MTTRRPLSVLILLATVTWLGSSAFADPHPPAGVRHVPDLGACGAPGDPETTCATCHSTTEAIEVTLALSLYTPAGREVTDYVPGASYDARVTVHTLRGDPAGYGFQAIALQAPLYADGPEVDGFSHPAANVHVVTAGNRRYAEHRHVSQDSIFSFRWTAPLTGNGVVSFYACGNGVDWTGDNTGDDADCLAVSYRERPVGTRPVRERTLPRLYPNPAGARLYLAGLPATSAIREARLYSAAGRLVGRRALRWAEGRYSLSVAALPPGIYFIEVAGLGVVGRFVRGVTP